MYPNGLLGSRRTRCAMAYLARVNTKKPSLALLALAVPKVVAEKPPEHHLCQFSFWFSCISRANCVYFHFVEFVPVCSPARTEKPTAVRSYLAKATVTLSLPLRGKPHQHAAHAELSITCAFSLRYKLIQHPARDVSLCNKLLKRVKSKNRHNVLLPVQ
jgi:hypothetical protein